MGHIAWYLAFFVAFVLILAVVICVASILDLARRISIQARELAVALNATGRNTDVLQAVPGVNTMIGSVYGVVGKIRTRVLEGRPAR